MTRIDYFFLWPDRLPPGVESPPGKGRTREEDRWHEQGTEIWQKIYGRLKELVDDLHRPQNKETRDAQDDFRELYQRLRQLDNPDAPKLLTRRPFDVPGIGPGIAEA